MNIGGDDINGRSIGWLGSTLMVVPRLLFVTFVAMFGVLLQVLKRYRTRRSRSLHLACGTRTERRSSCRLV